MAEIILAKCKGVLVKVLVDADDFAAMSKIRWQVNVSNKNGVHSSIRSSDGITKTVYMHRLIMNAKTGEYVDHINGNNRDNRKENLRITTNQENCQNRHGAYSNSTSGYRGVSLHKKYGKWEAYFWVNYIKYHVGFFDNAEDAAAAVTLARRENMPFSEMDKEGAVQPVTRTQHNEMLHYDMAA